jgi:hypothetical protein
MKLRPASTTSERQLLKALTESGRSASLATFADWRKEGLLPPFASQGRGPGKGKSYFWREENVGARAFFIHDLIRRHGRTDKVILILWLSGFDVSLIKFRRAWLHRVRTRKPWEVRKSAVDTVTAGKKEAPLTLEKRGTPTPILLNFILAVCDVFCPEQGSAELSAMKQIVALVLKKLGVIDADIPVLGKASQERLVILMGATCAFLETTDLVSVASEAEFNQAQQHLRIAGKFAHACVFNVDQSPPAECAPFWTAQLAETIASPLFLMILAILRAGYQRELELTGIELDRLMEYWKNTRCSRGITPKRLAANGKKTLAISQRQIRSIWQAPPR